MNKVQQLFNKLVDEYNLRAITIDNEQWYALNDLPLERATIRKKIERLNKELSDVTSRHVRDYVEINTKLIKNSYIKDIYVRNFNKVNNAGERFGNYKMIIYIIINSELGIKYKIELIEILDNIRTNDYYIDENITKENITKLETRIENLKNKIIDGNGGYSADKYKTLRTIANKWTKDKKIKITEHMLFELLIKNKWLDKEGYINKKASYGNKIIYSNREYYLSPKGYELLLRQLDKINNQDLISWSKNTTYNNKVF